MIASVNHYNFRATQNLFENITESSFFSVQLVSAQSLLALFPLCKISSIDCFHFKCIAWHD